MDAELTWVYEAVRIAEKVAAKRGWDSVPWQQVLDEVLAQTPDMPTPDMQTPDMPTPEA